MTIKYGFFTSQASVVDGETVFDRAVDEDFIASYFKGMFTNGIYPSPSNNFQVVANTGMSVKIRAGSGLFEGRHAYDTEEYSITLDAANASLPRIDSIVVRYDAVNRLIERYKITGTAATSPTAPAVTSSTDVHEYLLATIEVAAGTTSITSANITDQRGSDSCGYVRIIPETFDINDLYAQNNALFTDWFYSVKNQLSTDAAGNLQNQIDAINAGNKIYSTKPASPVTGDLCVPMDGYTEEEIYNGSAWIKRYPVNYPAYSAWRSSDTVKNGQQYDVVFNASDAADDNCSLSSGQVLISQAGNYLLDAGIFISDNAQVSDIWRIEITVLDNITTALQKIVSNAPASAAAGCYMHTCGIATIPAGKKIKIAAICAGSGGSFRVAGGSYKTYLRVQKL